MTQINIALGMTREWQKYARVTVASILLNASLKDDYKFYIMCDAFSQNDKIMFSKLSCIKDAEFEFIKMNNGEFDGAIHDWLGVSSSYRLKLSTLTKEDKILYLDSDIVVLKDIKELYSHDVSNYYLAGIEDKCSSFMRNRVGLREGEVFINGGVQLMNLDRFRKDNLEKVIFEKLRASSFYTDQDVINDVCRGRILSLPLKYNLMPVENAYLNRQQEYLETLKDPFVLHFTEKPWANKNIKFANFWIRYNEYLEKFIDI